MPEFNETLAPIRTLPIPSLEDNVAAPDNSEIDKVAQAVLEGLQYSFATIAADPSITVKAGTLEAETKAALAELPDTRRKAYNTVGKSLVGDDKVRKVLFGRAGALTPDTFIKKGGFDALITTVEMPKIDRKLLGLRDDFIRVPLDQLRQSEGGLSVEAEASLEKRLFTIEGVTGV